MAFSIKIFDFKAPTQKRTPTPITANFPFSLPSTQNSMFFLCADAALGRVDHLTMSQQALMECVVSQLDTKSLRKYQDDSGNLLDVDQWNDLTRDGADSIVGINWTRIGGTVDLRWLPLTLQSLTVEACPALHGSVDFQSLPSALVWLSIKAVALHGEFSLKFAERLKYCLLDDADFSGTLCLADVPENLQTILIQQTPLTGVSMAGSSETLLSVEVSDGALQGTLSFRNSPQSLQEIKLSRNKLEGTLSFAGLSARCTTLSLCGNNFHGTLSLSDLPKSVNMLHLGKNGFSEISGFEGLAESRMQALEIEQCGMSGEMHFARLPASVNELNLRENKLRGTVDLSGLAMLWKAHCGENQLDGTLDVAALPAYLSEVDLSANRLEGSLDCTALPQSVSIVYLQSNRFSGAIDLSRLPLSLTELRLNDNQLSGSFSLTNVPGELAQLNLANNRFEMERLVVDVQHGRVPLVDLRGNAIQKVVDAKGKQMRRKQIKL